MTARRHPRRMKPGVHYARIPLEVLESPAYSTLPYYAMALLVAIAAQYRGRNNGDLAITWSMARRLGIRSKGHHAKGLRLLKGRGLVKCTRKGGMRPFGPTLYAMTWCAIDERAGGYDPGIAATRTASNKWLEWQPEIKTTGPPTDHDRTIGGSVEASSLALTGPRAVPLEQSDRTAGSSPSRVWSAGELRSAVLLLAEQLGTMDASEIFDHGGRAKKLTRQQIEAALAELIDGGELGDISRAARS